MALRIQNERRYLKSLAVHLIYLHAGDIITNLDFNPSGETAATIGRRGTCLISDVNADEYRFHLNLAGAGFGSKTFNFIPLFHFDQIHLYSSY